MKYMVSSEEKPQNFPIYSIHSDMDSFILFNDEERPTTDDKPLALEQKTNMIQQSVVQNDATVLGHKPYEEQETQLFTPKLTQTPNAIPDQEILWYLEFDGSINRLGAGAGVWIHNKQNSYAEGHAYRLNFRCTNNMAEYEALLLGLKVIKSSQATKVSILGDSDLIIQKMKGSFVTNDNRLRAYRSAATKILNAFTEFQLTKI